MTLYLPRSQWTNVPAGGSRMPSNPRGVAVHWPGSTHPLGNPSARTVANRLEGYRRFHREGRGWADIAYQVGFDQAGRVWDLRGILRQSAANGNGATNRAWGAVLFLVGPGEHPSPAMIRAFNDWRRDRWLKQYPGATRVVGHRDVRPDGTVCPGSATYALIKTGDILRPEEEEGPLSKFTEEDLRDAAGTGVLTAQIGRAEIRPGEPLTVGIALQRMYGNSYQQTAQITAMSTAMRALAESAGADAEQIADIVDRAVRDRLDQLEVSVAEKQQEERS